MSAEQIELLERPELAAEFLFRNRSFQQDRQQLLHGVASSEMTEEEADALLSQCWGLSFRRSFDIAN